MSFRTKHSVAEESHTKKLLKQLGGMRSLHFANASVGMTKLKKIDIITVLGIISLTFWVVDLINNFFIHHLVWSLWISSVGIGMTAFSLLTRNTFLMNSLFCALFIIESFWGIGFFSHLIFGTSPLGLTSYLFDGKHTITEMFITSYHVLIAPFLFIGILKEKVIHKKAWIGAAIFAASLCLLTYFAVGKNETVNCVHSIEKCQPFLSFLSNITNPMRTLLGIIFATLVLFIPTNYLLMKVGDKLNFSRESTS